MKREGAALERPVLTKYCGQYIYIYDAPIQSNLHQRSSSPRLFLKPIKLNLNQCLLFSQVTARLVHLTTPVEEKSEIKTIAINKTF